jgi:cytochrome c oxidase cbb3-type subunit 4
MDINDLRSLFTVVTFTLFVAIVWWAYSGKRKQAFEEAALLPFTDDEPVEAAKPAAHRANERKAS